MNTDNTSISGETIDYGPCAFMETYDPDTVFSSIDLHGCYAYSNQTRIARWNLTRHADFEPPFKATRDAGLRRKLGLFTEREGDAALA